jgi:hypothetical protein
MNFVVGTTIRQKRSINLGKFHMVALNYRVFHMVDKVFFNPRDSPEVYHRPFLVKNIGLR